MLLLQLCPPSSLAQPSPRNAPIAHQQPNINALSMLSELQSGHVEDAAPAQVIGNNYMRFNSLSKHSSLKSKKYAAMLSVLIKEFASSFQDHKKKNPNFFGISATSFSIDINTLPGNGVYRVAVRHSTQKSDHISLNSYKPSLTRENHPSLHNHTSFMSSLFGSTHNCEQLFLRMKYRMCKISSKI